MTVLHIIEPFAGGVTTFIAHLTSQQPEHKHIVLHGRRTSVDKIEEVRRRFPREVEFVEWDYVQREIRPWTDLKAFLFLVRFLKRTDFDIIHLHSSKAGFLGRIACFFLGIRSVIYTPHAAPFLRRDINGLTKRFYVFLEKFSSLLPGPIVCCCQAELKEYQDIGIDVLCINNGTVRSDIRKAKPEAKTYVICAALLTPQKNPVRFNEIAAFFKDRSDVQFCWIGDGELRNRITSPNIQMTGWLPPAEVTTYYQRASIYLATSDWEGLPYSVLEAMNAGCCLLLSNRGGHADVVRSGQNGFLFETKQEAIELLSSLLSDPEKVARMGNASREICADSFDAGKMAEGYNALYLRSAK